MMRGFWTRMLKIGRMFRAKVSLVDVRLRYGKEGFPADLDIATGVRISVTDGGRVFFEPGCNIDRNATIIVKHGRLTVGPNVHVGIGSVIVARESIQVGRDVLLAEYVTIRDQDHVFDGAISTANSGFTTAPIVIGDNVWLGAKVTVTKGVTIGNNAVIGANSVVTRDIPANVLAVGVPARVIRELRSGERPTGAGA